MIRAFRQECSAPSAYIAPNGRVAPAEPWYALEPNNHEHDETFYNWDACRRYMTHYMTHAGFRVRSKAEKIIADFLTHSGLKFLYEPVLNVGEVRMRPDFYLTEYALPYEHFGLNTEPYLRAAELKLARYHRAGVPFMYTTFRDEPDIEDAIVDKLAAATIDL